MLTLLLVLAQLDGGVAPKALPACPQVAQSPINVDLAWKVRPPGLVVIDGRLDVRTGECLAVACPAGQCCGACNYFLSLVSDHQGSHATIELLHKVVDRNGFSCAATCRDGVTTTQCALPTGARVRFAGTFDEYGRLVVDWYCDPAAKPAPPPAPPPTPADASWLDADRGCPGGFLRGQHLHDVWCELPDGKRHGPELKWASSSGLAPGELPRLVERGSWALGLKHGTWDSELAARCRRVSEYRKGVEVSRTDFHCSGGKAAEGAVKNGERDGAWRQWDEQGNEQEPLTCKRGKCSK